MHAHRSPDLTSDVVTIIPDNAIALYVGSIADARSFAQVEDDTRPYGMIPIGKHWHLVVWNGRPVWVISSAAHLVPMV